VLWRKNARVENQYFIQNTWSLSLSKVPLLPTKGTGKCPFYCQQDTVLNIIPVDYVAKLLLLKEMMLNSNIVNDKSFNIARVAVNYEGSRLQ
jgi:hypothetical protein